MEMRNENDWRDMDKVLGKPGQSYRKVMVVWRSNATEQPGNRSRKDRGRLTPGQGVLHQCSGSVLCNSEGQESSGY